MAGRARDAAPTFNKYVSVTAASGSAGTDVSRHVTVDRQSNGR